MDRQMWESESTAVASTAAQIERIEIEREREGDAMCSVYTELSEKKGRNSSVCCGCASSACLLLSCPAAAVVAGERGARDRLCRELGQSSEKKQKSGHAFYLVTCSQSPPAPSSSPSSPTSPSSSSSSSSFSSSSSSTSASSPEAVSSSSSPKSPCSCAGRS